MFSRQTFLEQLRQGLSRVDARNRRLLIAVSGGKDSTALLLACHELRGEFGLELVVAHFHHQLRGLAADADAAAVVRLAEHLSLESHVGKAGPDLWAGTREGRPAFAEEAARRARYEFLNNIAEATRSELILTAHTADDQLETVLHHIFRGTGLHGLQGIPWRRSSGGVMLVRPMLAISRLSVEAYLSERGTVACEDATNSDTYHTRNWLRHVLVPLVRSRFPSVDTAVARLARQAADIADVMQHLASEALEAAWIEGTRFDVRLVTEPLRDRPRHIVRETFVELWNRQHWPRQEMGYDRWDELAGLVQMTQGAITFPGRITARVRDGELRITSEI